MNLRQKHNGNRSETLECIERHLTVWLGLYMSTRLVLSRLFPAMVDQLRGMEFSKGSQVSVPVAFLSWLMVIPMMMTVDFKEPLKNSPIHKGRS